MNPLLLKAKAGLRMVTPLTAVVLTLAHVWQSFFAMGERDLCFTALADYGSASYVPCLALRNGSVTEVACPPDFSSQAKPADCFYASEHALPNVVHAAPHSSLVHPFRSTHKSLVSTLWSMM
ncbi:hypothetical protein [Magnetococcus sp. PR-3]|uniref:hypothetical protein n=1 Tax=Magnetococcus sp. PR-3 TaxID=3120355 RepID=UPI002FCDF4AF